MKRRIRTAWTDKQPIFCQICRHRFPDRLIIDNQLMRTEPTELQKPRQDVFYVGVSDLTCPTCNIPYVLQVELVGSYFQRTGMAIIPVIRFFRVPKDVLENTDQEKTRLLEDLELIQEWRLEKKTTALQETLYDRNSQN